MKIKKGFTLAEVIIAVGVIAVIAALMASVFNHVQPDRTKFMYLKAYDALCEVVSKMGESKSLYEDVITVTFNDASEATEVNIMNVPFMDLKKHNGCGILLGSYNNVTISEGDDYLKFAKLLMGALKGEFKDSSGEKFSFTSDTGDYLWTVTAPQSNYTLDKDKAGFANEVTLKIGDEDDFRFCIQADGEIQVLDETLGKNRGWTYIANRRKPKSENDITKFTGITTCTTELYTMQKEEDGSFSVTDMKPQTP